MSRLAIVARADDGGLGNQTRDVVRHLGPDVCLIVAMGDDARGREDPRRVVDAMRDRSPVDRWTAINPGPKLFDEILTDVLDRCDVLYTIEGPYHPELFQRCDAAGVELVIHANPELYKQWPCHRLLVPTSWRTDRMPPTAELLPHPVDVERLTPWPRRDTVPTFVHLTGPAMLDRQGTQLVMAALPYVEHECFLWIRRDERSLVQDHVGNVTVGWLPPADEYWQAIPGGSWALLQPRRYGGLSLCIQEAAARGMFTISLDRDPESSFYADVTLRAPLTEEQPYPMAGGEVAVGDTSPQALASVIDAFIDAPGDPAVPRAWAEAHSWDVLLPAYERVLRR